MTFEELLVSLELTEEQITSITSGMAENNIFLTAENNVKERLEKMKRERDEARSNSKELTERVAELEESSKTSEEKETELNDFKAKFEALESETNSYKRKVKLEKLLNSNGFNSEYIDYLLDYKLKGGSELELDEKGEFSNFDLDDFKANNAKYLNVEKPEAPTGWQVIDNKLNDGNQAQPQDPFQAKIAEYK